MGEERKEKKEKTERVGPPILSLMGEAGCLPGTQSRDPDSETETHVSPTYLRLSTSGPGGWGGTRQIRAKGEGGSPGRVLGGRGALERGMRCDLQNVASSVFSLTRPWYYLGVWGGEWDGKCDGGRWIQRIQDTTL